METQHMSGQCWCGANHKFLRGQELIDAVRATMKRVYGRVLEDQEDFQIVWQLIEKRFGPDIPDGRTLGALMDAAQMIVTLRAQITDLEDQLKIRDSRP